MLPNIWEPPLWGMNSFRSSKKTSHSWHLLKLELIGLTDDYMWGMCEKWIVVRFLDWETGGIQLPHAERNPERTRIGDHFHSDTFLSVCPLGVRVKLWVGSWVFMSGVLYVFNKSISVVIWRHWLLFWIFSFCSRSKTRWGAIEIKELCRAAFLQLAPKEQWVFKFFLRLIPLTCHMLGIS